MARRAPSPTCCNGWSWWHSPPSATWCRSKGLNRAYVTQGLKIMARRENLGLSALADIARLKRKPDPYALGFLLGPRINAAGRVGNAGLALELLTTRDRGRASQLAQELETAQPRAPGHRTRGGRPGGSPGRGHAGPGSAGRRCWWWRARAGIRAWSGWPPRGSRNASTAELRPGRGSRRPPGRGLGPLDCRGGSRRLRCARRWSRG